MSYLTILNIRVSRKYQVFNKQVYYIKMFVQQAGFICLVQSCSQFLNIFTIKAKLLILKPQPVTLQIFLFHCFFVYVCVWYVHTYNLYCIPMCG